MLLSKTVFLCSSSCIGRSDKTNLANVGVISNRFAIWKYGVYGYHKDKTTELAANSKNKNVWDLCRGVTEFKNGYQ
jgi:hypothetical protein